MDQHSELIRLRNENRQLKHDLAVAQAANFPLRERLQLLEAHNRELRLQLQQREQLLQQLQQQQQANQARLAQLEQRLAALDLPPAKPSTDHEPPAWVKPNKPRTDRPARSKRKPEQNNARRRDPNPSHIQQHQLAQCPDCGHTLATQQLARRRQVIELPPPQAVETTEHQVFKGWCGHCRRWHSPKLDLHEEVLGQGRIGVRLASLIATLRYQGRLPIEIIQSLLHELYSCDLSRGGIVGVLRQLRQQSAAAFAELLRQVRASAVLHMDESGWRENGHNGYVWEMATDGALAVRLFVRDESRAGAVMEQLLGGEFKGVLVTDFYCGYNGYAGAHQRCWVHLLRDLRELKQQQPDNEQVSKWVKAVRGLYDRGKQVAAGGSGKQERGVWAQSLQRQAVLLGKQYAQQAGHPCHALAQRLLRHQDELFVFVRQAGVPADNNLAERGVRPLVIARKISGGTRSAEGSVTYMRLASLFGTWRARGQNPFLELQHLLRKPRQPQTAAPLL